MGWCAPGSMPSGARSTAARPPLIWPAASAARDLGLCWPSAMASRTRWCGDITYIATWEGWLYLATVIDIASRRVVGFAVADHLRTEDRKSVV